LMHEAVLLYAGSYPIIPKSSGFTLICRRSMVLMESCVIGSSYDLPVRLSVMVIVSRRVAPPSVDLLCVVGSAESIRISSPGAAKDAPHSVTLYTKAGTRGNGAVLLPGAGRRELIVRAVGARD